MNFHNLGQKKENFLEDLYPFGFKYSFAGFETGGIIQNLYHKIFVHVTQWIGYSWDINYFF